MLKIRIAPDIPTLEERAQERIREQMRYHEYNQIGVNSDLAYTQEDCVSCDEVFWTKNVHTHYCEACRDVDRKRKARSPRKAGF